MQIGIDPHRINHGEHRVEDVDRVGGNVLKHGDRALQLVKVNVNDPGVALGGVEIADGDEFTLTTRDVEGDSKQASVSFEHLMAMARGETTFDLLYLSGLLRVKGNLSKGAEMRLLLGRRQE